MNQTEKGNAILFIRPNAEFVIRDNVLEWLDDNQIEPTEKEIEQGLKDYKAAKTTEAQAKAEAKSALLEKLGITQDEANLLLN